MYNKLFAKILDSSLWLESDGTRLVWVTFLAVMDQDGFCQFASVANLAHRARVSIEATEDAVRVLEGPDAISPGQDYDGRRVERVPGGWMVLNAQKYKDLVTTEIQREQTRERVRRHRDKKRVGNATGNADVTQSETETQVERTTWLTAIAAAYESRKGLGSFPFGKAGKLFKPLRDAGHEPAEIALRLGRYIDRLDDQRFFSLGKFRETFGDYATDLPAVTQNGKSGKRNAGEETYRNAHAALEGL